MARADRRRRVLNEEIRAAGSLSVSHSFSESTIDSPRYGEQANIENHPQVTDFVPRRNRVVLLTVLAGLLIAAAAESLDRYAGELSAWLPSLTTLEIAHGLANRLVAWGSAVVLLAVAAFVRITFMLRRHRVDDYRGRYRVWRLAAWMALALSLNAVVGLHGPISRALGEWTGWQLLVGHSGWWLAAAVLLGGWLLVRLVLDMAECRAALAIVMLAITCYMTAGVASAVPWSPEWLGAWSGLPGRSLPFFGHLLMLSAVMLNARYVVLDVQGLIPSRRQKSRMGVAKPQAAESSPPSAADESIDGIDSESDFAHDKKHRLSKSERKQLRKQKARHAA